MKKIRRIYHIDDDDDDRYFFEIALKEYDNSIRVIGEKDVELALKNLSSGAIEPIDIIVVDLNMPKVWGNDCVAEIKKMERCHDIPVMILSTSSNPVDKAEAEQNGAFFVTKPSSLKEMIEKIRGVIVDVCMQWLHLKPSK